MGGQAGVDAVSGGGARRGPAHGLPAGHRKQPLLSCAHPCNGCRMLTSEAAPKVADESLDYVYVGEG